MGWDSTTIGSVRPIDFFKREVNSYGRWEVVDCEMVGTVIYAAVKSKLTGRVIGIVWLTTYAGPGPRFNFSWKEMTESSHPFYYGCPDKILDLLSPTEDEGANEWRRLCRENNLQTR